MTIIGAVSPAGGDFSEPITQHSLRLAGTFWALDTTLARQRHFPAIDWNRSYTLYDLAAWFGREVAADWEEQRAWARELLQREAQLLEVVQLLGADTLGAARARRAPHRSPAARGLPPAVRVRRARRLLRPAQAAGDAAGDPARRRGDERRGGPRRTGRARPAPRPR